MIKYFNGDLLTAPNIEIVAHQVNCLGIMGSGIAKQIKDKYPQVFKEYKEFCNTHPKNDLLGCCTMSSIGDNIWIANLFGQYGISNKICQTDYIALEKAMIKLLDITIIHNFKIIGMPYNIGCGAAKGDWSIVQEIIDNIFLKASVELQIWKL